VGRWTSVDPLAEHPNQIDKSPYAYAWNNPILLNDPDGQCPNCIIGAIAGGIAGAIIGAAKGKNVPLGQRLKNAGKGLVVGGIGGALVGSGFGLIAPAVGAVGAEGFVIGSVSGGVLGGAGANVASQSIEIASGEREGVDVGEVWKEALIGVPTGLFGGAVGGAAGSAITGEAKRQLGKQVYSRAAVRGFKKDAKRNL
jgi:hypothetical protein